MFKTDIKNDDTKRTYNDLQNRFKVMKQVTNNVHDCIQSMERLKLAYHG